MATQQISPGVLTREVDLTVGRVDNVVANSGGIAGPFKIGPVSEIITITNESDLIETFGKPLSTDSQYEYWMSASSFLSYGGQLKVVRADGANLKNANAGAPVGSSAGTGYTTTLKIKNFDDYDQNFQDVTGGWTWGAKNPGTWANGLKVCYIDDYADQTVGITTTDLEVAGFEIGCGVTVAYSGTTVGLGTTTTTNGYVKGIITGLSTDSTNANSTIDVKIVSKVETTGSSIGTETYINYAQFDNQASITTGSIVYCVSSAGTNKGGDYKIPSVNTAGTCTDWYDNQVLDLSNGTVYWNTIASKPQTNGYVEARNGKNDAFHLVVVDDNGSITGNEGTIIEKNISISKALGAVSDVNSPQSIYYKDFVANQSEYLFAGWNPSQGDDNWHDTAPRATGFTTTSGTKSLSFVPVPTGDGAWGNEAQGTTFSAIGNVGYAFSGGVNYNENTNQYAINLGDVSNAYDLFENEDEVDVDFLIMGPGCGAKDESQSKANKLISLAEARKDCVAVISPHKSDVVNVTKSSDQTNNVVAFYTPVTSSSYAVFDSGWKWSFDRYNNKFRWVPTNADVAGLMVRTDIEQFPWYSPAGNQRGNINNAVKLAFNPSKSQRDVLYENRVNPITNLPGSGIVLYGDKTGLSYASAFDRINVRRLFITVEQALTGVANDQLFEFNDEITRSNFVNIVEPYLRDVQAKRGLVDFRVICDQTNNTPEVIDNNEFRADIFLKPTRSINFVTLTFVATRTGVNFSEVTGRV